MQLARPALPRTRAVRPRDAARAVVRRQSRDGASRDDLKLFAMTFVAGFLFVSILIG